MTDPKKCLFVNTPSEMADVVQAMDTIVRSMNDEYPYMRWITVVPNDADRSDFEDIANNPELLEDTLTLFSKIVNHELKDYRQ